MLNIRQQFESNIQLLSDFKTFNSKLFIVKNIITSSIIKSYVTLVYTLLMLSVPFDILMIFSPNNINCLLQIEEAF